MKASEAVLFLVFSRISRATEAHRPPKSKFRKPYQSIKGDLRFCLLSYQSSGAQWCWFGYLSETLKVRDDSVVEWHDWFQIISIYHHGHYEWLKTRQSIVTKQFTGQHYKGVVLTICNRSYYLFHTDAHTHAHEHIWIHRTLQSKGFIFRHRFNS